MGSGLGLGLGLGFVLSWCLARRPRRLSPVCWYWKRLSCIAGTIIAAAMGAVMKGCSVQLRAR